MIEVLQAIIIALGNFSGILVAYYLLERRTDRKILKYWRKIKSSEEGEDLFTIFKELRKVLKSSEMQEMMGEAREVISEFRALLKKMKERAEAIEEEEDETEFPSLVSVEKGT